MRLLALSAVTVLLGCGGDDTSPTGPMDGGKDVIAAPDTYKPPLTCMTGAKCNGTNGLCAPVADCPCGDAGITTAFTMPVCKTTDPSRKAFDDGAPRTWMDSVNDAGTGEQRAACVYTPPGASASSKRPLVVFLHVEGGSASDIYNSTSLRDKATSFDMYAATGDAGVVDAGGADGGATTGAGFILASDQGRNLAWPSVEPAGAHHDIYYRDGDNPDVRNIDRLIDELVAVGNVDTSHIFLMGWGNGGFFAEAYTMQRGTTPTAGGNYVNSAAVYSAADPFQSPMDMDPPGCMGAAQPTQTPILIVGRNCDLVACDLGQVYVMRQPPGYNADLWFTHLHGVLGDPGAQRIILDPNGQTVGTCSDATCDNPKGTTNHFNWPDGVADKSGRAHDAPVSAHQVDVSRCRTRPRF